VIADEAPGVVVLNEVLRGCVSGQYGGVDQVAVLRDALPAYRFAFFAPWEADYDQGAGQGRCQIGSLLLSRYPIIESSFIDLPSESVYQRGLLDALVSVQGAQVRVYGTHLQNQQGGDPAADVDRRRQAEAIVAYAGELEEPTLLLGDLNDVPSATELAPLFEVFDDAWVEGGDGSPGYTMEAANPTRRIDYVLVSPDVDVLEARVLETLASDHRPVVAELAVPVGPK
jgi:endonuclease/exonuclease/phosphatase family metal-dependent hydrolase